MRLQILGACLAVLLLTGCSGIAVVDYGVCSCPEENQPPAQTPSGADSDSASLKTGLAVIAGMSDSRNAEKVDYNVTVAAVAVDGGGIIRQCILDGISAQVTVDGGGTITSDITAAVPTKNELGEAYGMKAYGGATYEWDRQAAALADYAVGKTVQELQRSALNAEGYAAAPELVTSATIKLDTLVQAVVQAANSAQQRGMQAGDTLHLAVISSLSGSTSATADSSGIAQLDSDFAVVSRSGNTISSCYIDSLQAKAAFDAAGTITSDIAASIPTKNELGEAYGMKAFGGATCEWDQQAESFSRFVTGKTLAEVAGLATPDGYAANADLAASVTVRITGFQALIAKVFS